jgi:hypothetical protein
MALAMTTARSRTEHGNYYPTPLHGGAMLPQENSLPGAKQKAPITYRYGKPGIGQHAACMRCHVVRPFKIMLVFRIAIGCEARDDHIKIASYIGIGIFRDRQGATGVLHKDISQSALHTGLRDYSCDGIRNVAGAAPGGGKLENGLMSHRLNPS